MWIRDRLVITTAAATPTEILTATMRQIRCPPFRKRFNEYIESEENPMTYINEKHRARFTLAAKNILKAKYAWLAALYLHTACLLYTSHAFSQKNKENIHRRRQRR